MEGAVGEQVERLADALAVGAGQHAAEVRGQRAELRDAAGGGVRVGACRAAGRRARRTRHATAGRCRRHGAQHQLERLWPAIDEGVVDAIRREREPPTVADRGADDVGAARLDARRVVGDREADRHLAGGIDAGPAEQLGRRVGARRLRAAPRTRHRARARSVRDRWRSHRPCRWPRPGRRGASRRGGGRARRVGRDGRPEHPGAGQQCRRACQGSGWLKHGPLLGRTLRETAVTLAGPAGRIVTSNDLPGG